MLSTTSLYYLSIGLCAIWLIKKYFNGPATTLGKNVDMTGKVVIITGANSGIGKETALELLEKGAKVVFASRDAELALSAINNIPDKHRENAVFIKLDLCNFESILAFVDKFKSRFPTFDILINNAGRIVDHRSIVDNIEQTLYTNHIGNVILTSMLIDSINPNGKIINVSSEAYSFINQRQFEEFLTDVNCERSSYNFLTRLSITKLANVFHAIQLDKFLTNRKKEVKTASLNPGRVASPAIYKFENWMLQVLVRIFLPLIYLTSKDCKMGAQTTLHVVYMDYDKLNSGAYFDDCKEVKLNDVARSEQNMWKLSQKVSELVENNMKRVPEEVKEFLNFKE